MNPALRNKLIAAAGTGAIAIAGILGHWYEGNGPTVVRQGVTYHRVYLDTGGVPTVCRGVTGPEVIRDKLYSAAECRALETKHLKAAGAAAKRLIAPWPQLNEWQQGALIDFVYNLGAGALEGSTLRKKFNAGDIDGGCRELARWVKSRVKGELITLAGLVDRRGTEQELCEAWGR
jgi:lysozyme